MKKMILMISCCMAICLVACGTESPKGSGTPIEGSPITQSEQNNGTDAGQNGGATAEQKSEITQEQALDAIKNYCISKDPQLESMVDSEDYSIYWDVTMNDANEIVVLYRSYTAAQIRYYVNPSSGETYVTEMVPGIMDEEQKTDESFNIRDYLD